MEEETNPSWKSADRLLHEKGHNCDNCDIALDQLRSEDLCRCHDFHWKIHSKSDKLVIVYIYEICLYQLRLRERKKLNYSFVDLRNVTQCAYITANLPYFISFYRILCVTRLNAQYTLLHIRAIAGVRFQDSSLISCISEFLRATCR